MNCYLPGKVFIVIIITIFVVTASFLAHNNVKNLSCGSLLYYLVLLLQHLRPPYIVYSISGWYICISGIFFTFIYLSEIKCI